MTPELVHDWFHRNAARSGDRTAISSRDGSLTYRELAGRARRLAHHLAGSGTPRGSVVGVLADGAAEVVPALLGALEAGCAFLPLDPSYPAERLRAIVREASPAWLLADPRHAGLADDLLATAPGTRRIETGAAGSREQGGPLSLDLGPDDLCYVYYTSGSTGTPKGIAGRHKGLAHFLRWEVDAFGLGEETRGSLLTRPSFDVFLRDALVPLCAGGTLCVPEAGADVRYLIDWLDRERVTLCHIVPTLFRALLNEGLEPSLFPALRTVLLAGEMLYPADVKRWRAVFGDRMQLVNLYGPTETTLAKLWHAVRPEDEHRTGSVPVGRPLPGAAALVVDERGRPCPPGTVGEVYIRTPYASLGYYRRPDLTEQSFVPNPFGDDPEDRVYKTGDLARVLEDGSFELVGRKDQQVKIRGVRVELGEVEGVLRRHPGLLDGTVVDWPDASGERILCAYYVPRYPVAPEEIAEHLGRDLPATMIPSSFVELEELPRTLTGKIDRRALPSPAENRQEREEEYVAPRNEIEEAIAAITTEVLKLRRMSVTANLFTAGGNSLQAMVILSRVRARFETEVPLGALFENPSVAHLAEIVASSSSPGGDAIPRLDR